MRPETATQRRELVRQLLDERYPGGGARVAYEVADAAGRCLYRGTDLGLACEVHDGDPGAHLSRRQTVPRQVPGRSR